VVLLAGSSLLLPLSASPSHAASLAQLPNPEALLEASAAAIENVQSMRYATEASVEQPDVPGATGSMPSLTGTGAFQAPDRYQMATQVGTTGQRLEGIVIGRSWGRYGDGPWHDGGPGPVMAGGPVDPMALAAMLRDYPRYLVAPTVREEGDEYVVSGMLDPARLAEDPEAGWRFGGTSFFGGPSSDFEMTRSEVELRIDRLTRYLRELRTTTSLRYVPTNLPEGVPTDALSPFEMRMVTDLTISDYDDPSIQITPPE
jgi:hypothetical protein